MLDSFIHSFIDWLLLQYKKKKVEQLSIVWLCLILINIQRISLPSKQTYTLTYEEEEKEVIICFVTKNFVELI